MPENPHESKSSKNNSKMLLLCATVLILIFSAIGAVLVLGNNSEKNSNQDSNRTSTSSSKQSNQTSNSSDIKITSLGGFEFGPYDASTAASGSFIFAKDAATQAGGTEMLIFPFGQQVCESEDQCKVLPELGFHGLKLGTKVKAIADGKIVEVRDQGNNDFAFSTVFDNSNTALNYDHLSNVTLKVNERVKAGDVIGEVAPYGDGKYGRVEIMLKKVDQQTNEATYLCPIDYLDSSIKTTLVADLKQFFTDWNTFYGKDVHNLSEMNPVGCLKSYLTESQVGQ